MKTLLRAFVVTMVAVTATVGATAAYFTANVSASNNQITTGTMVAYVGTYANPTGDANGQWVAYADATGPHQLGNFPTITNVQPGETKSTYAVVLNYGTLPFQYQAWATGSWNFTPSVNYPMAVTQVHRYAANNCEGDLYCEDIYYWLTAAAYTNVSTGAHDYGAVTGTFGGADADHQLSQNQFTVYRVDLTLDAEAGNEYQGKTFTYTLNVDTKQLNAPTF